MWKVWVSEYQLFGIQLCIHLLYNLDGLSDMAMWPWTKSTST